MQLTEEQRCRAELNRQAALERLRRRKSTQPAPHAPPLAVRIVSRMWAFVQVDAQSLGLTTGVDMGLGGTGAVRHRTLP